MKNPEKLFQQGNPRPIRGRRIVAPYREPEDPDHRGNPLIEALPAVWDWDEEDPKIMDKLNCYFLGSEELRKQSNVIRMSELNKFKLRFFQVFNRHRYVEENFSILIRNGYVGRNPINPRFRRDLHDKVDELINESEDDLPPIMPAGNLGFALLGSPGMGKTTSLAKILRLYPQVIQHKNYPAAPDFSGKQVVWLFLTCPHDSSTRGLCLQFFGELDAILGIVGNGYYNYYEREIENALIMGMATVAAQLSLGVLIIDELQFLDPAKSGGKSNLLKFIVQLENTIGIPVVLVGTHAAAPLVAGSPHQARRSDGIGGATWDRFMPDSDEWRLFLKIMWEHQYLREYVPLDSADFSSVIYAETQGVLSYAVNLFYFAQREAIAEGTEKLTIDSIRWAAENKMIYSRPYVNALRSDDPVASRLLEHIVPAKYNDFKAFAKNDLLLPDIPEGDNLEQNKNNNNASKVNSRDKQSQKTTPPAGGEIPAIHPPPPGTSITGSIPPRPCRNKRGKKPIYPAGTLMAIWQEAKEKDNINPCDAFEAVGLARAVTEFLPPLPVP